MSASGIRNQYLYINSENRHSGHPWDFDVVFKPGMIKANDNETLKISLVQMSMPLTINQVNSLNNSIQFKNLSTNQTTTITILEGNWNVYDLANYVKNAYTPITNLSFDKSTNHFIFDFQTDHMITFLDDANYLFGFSSNIPETSGRGDYESDIPVIPNPITDMVLSVFDVSPVSHNLDNFANAEMRMTNMIGFVPITDIPFGVLRYDNINGEFAISLADKEIKRLRFTLKDLKDRLLNYCNLPDYTMLIKIQFVKGADETVQLLREMRDFTKYSFLANQLQS